MKPAAGVAHEHERTAGAEQVAGREQGNDQQPAVVHPREHRGEVSRCELRTEETVKDNGRGDEQDHELSGGSNVSPTKHCANHGPVQDVHCHGQFTWPVAPWPFRFDGRSGARPGGCLYTRTTHSPIIENRRAPRRRLRCARSPGRLPAPCRGGTCGIRSVSRSANGAAWSDRAT